MSRLGDIWFALNWRLYDWRERVLDRIAIVLGWAVARWALHGDPPYVLVEADLVQRAAAHLAITAFDVGRGGYGTFQWTTVSVEEMQRTAELLYDALEDTFEEAYPVRREEPEYSLK